MTQKTYYNWAGYAVTSSKPVTKAIGSWIEPSASCNTNLQGDQGVVFWVGIDGLTDGTVEQTGTFAYCTGGTTPTYYAWYEFYPAQPIEVISGFTVHPGDVFKATISAPSDTSFKVTLTDVTTGKTSSESQPSGFSGERTSAECITETPSGSGGYFYLPDFGTSDWGHHYTKVMSTCSATIGGKNAPIGAYGADSWQLTMCNYSSCTVTLVTTSNLLPDKESFTTTWDNAGP